MARDDVYDLAHRLGRQAETVCKHYLSNGHRKGRYWLVGDVRNSVGRSMFVRLTGPESGKGAVGRWTDAATAEYGDLLDVIRESCGLTDFRQVVDEARSFLSLPRSEPAPAADSERAKAPTASAESARRLLAMSRPFAGTLVEMYLRNRGITALHGIGNALRFHPRCYYRSEGHNLTDAHYTAGPAMIASVTDLSAKVTGAHRTWLSPDGSDKALVETPRRAMGHLLGHGVRFGVAQDVAAAGEGIETVLSVRSGLPHLPMMAALSAAHLSAIQFPVTLRRLYILCDRDPAGKGARDSLIARASAVGIEAVALSPLLGDFNEDLRQFGINALRAAFRVQIVAEDVSRFLG